jgi:hypothetical protein
MGLKSDEGGMFDCFFVGQRLGFAKTLSTDHHCDDCSATSDLGEIWAKFLQNI